MAECTTITCPPCRTRNVIHSLSLYDMMPKTLSMNDQSLFLNVGICERTGLFVFRASDGWHVQGKAANHTIFLGENEDIDE